MKTGFVEVLVNSQPEQMRARTKQFALRIVRLFKALPTTTDAQVMGKQLLRSGTSVAANYRAVCRARSKQEFAAKMGVVLEEADESVFWLEMLGESGTLPPDRLLELLKEAKELTAIFTTSRQTVRLKRK